MNQRDPCCPIPTALHDREDQRGTKCAVCPALARAREEERGKLRRAAKEMRDLASALEEFYLPSPASPASDEGVPDDTAEALDIGDLLAANAELLRGVGSENAKRLCRSIREYGRKCAARSCASREGEVSEEMAMAALESLTESGWHVGDLRDPQNLKQMRAALRAAAKVRAQRNK